MENFPISFQFFDQRSQRTLDQYKTNPLVTETGKPFRGESGNGGWVLLSQFYGASETTHLAKNWVNGHSKPRRGHSNYCTAEMMA